RSRAAKRGVRRNVDSSLGPIAVEPSSALRRLGLPQMPGSDLAADRISAVHDLQRSLGNHAVQRLLRAESILPGERTRLRQMQNGAVRTGKPRDEPNLTGSTELEVDWDRIDGTKRWVYAQTAAPVRTGWLRISKINRAGSLQRREALTD